MSSFLCNDLVINEDACNLACQYCLTGQSNLKEGHKDQMIFAPPRIDDYGMGHPLKERLDRIIERSLEKFNPPLLKITGGEIFLIRNIENFITHCSGLFERVIVQTNGAFLNEKTLEKLESLGNIVLQISLDSHHFEGNSYRVSRPDLHRKILHKIERALSSDLDIEVYCVLNNKSILHLDTFAEWLSAFAPRVLFFPFALRGPDSHKYQLSSEQHALVDQFADQYDHWYSILGPRAYYERLRRFYHDQERQFSCHLPRLVFSSFSDGIVTSCPNIWFDNNGNFLTEAGLKSLDHLGSSGLYKALLAEKPRLAACKKCYTPWDILSLYFDDEITLDELCQNPAYQGKRAQHIIRTTKINWRKGQIKTAADQRVVQNA